MDKPEFRKATYKMNLIKEDRENKKMFSASVICGVITIIAVLALILTASFVKMPTVVRVLIIIFAAATAGIGIGVAVVLDVKAGYFECPYCRELFIPTTKEYVKGSHTLSKRKLTCPSAANPECARNALPDKGILSAQP